MLKRNIIIAMGSLALFAVGVLAATAMGGGGYDHPTVSTQTTGGGHTPVTICHKPGTPAEMTLVVDDDSVELTGHLGHGDTVGPCETTPTDTTPTDTTPTTPTETTPTTPSGPRCPPGMVPTAGKDGQPGNDECEFPKTTPATPTTPNAVQPTTPPPTDPATTTSTPTTTAPPATKPPVTKPPKKVAPKPQPKKPNQKPDNPPKTQKVKHACATLADGTHRRWYKGGKGIKPGCYPIVPGDG